MDKDWSTINVQRDQVFGRDSDEMRQRLAQHHETLTSLIQSAPTEELVRRYSDVRMEVEKSIQRLDELSRSGAGASSSAYTPPPPGAATARPGTWTNTGPMEPAAIPGSAVASPTGQNNRTLILLLLGVVALAALGMLGWRYLKHRGNGKVVETAASSSTDTAREGDSRIVDAPRTAPVDGAATGVGGLRIKPASQDFGKVRKGTRIVKKVQIVNDSSETLTVSAGRSQCHCLWFQFTSKVPAGGKVTMSVTLDGARAKKGSVRETITLTSKEHPEEKSTLGVTAQVE